jgi:hypothetical protein
LRRLLVGVAQFNAAQEVLASTANRLARLSRKFGTLLLLLVQFDDVAFVVGGEVIGHGDPPSFAPTSGRFEQQRLYCLEV